MKLGLLLFLCFNLFAQSWSVVYVKKNIYLQKRDLINIYFKKMNNKNGQHLVAFNLSSSHPARLAFLTQVLKTDLVAWDSYYDELYFRGIKSPPVLKSAKAMMQYLQKVEGAIGYIPSADLTKNFTEITRFSF